MTSGHKKFIFLVQGEGRGHMTQAISLYQILTKNGHEVTYVFIGKSRRRQIPLYFREAFHSSVEAIHSPNFISDSRNKSIRLIPSILYNAFYLPRYVKSLRRINAVVIEKNPDAMISFYDFLGGFYHLFYRPDHKFFAIGHQFMTDHPEFEFAKGKSLHRYLFIINNRLNSLNAYKKLALSFRPYSPGRIRNTVIVPPLLRKGLSNLTVSRKDYILGYMVNDGYGQEIMDWSNKNPTQQLEVFWDKKDEPEVKIVGKALTFHKLNADKFLELMANCKGLVTTAGFESICESMFLGKPVLMIPVEGQYEQACNAIDAVKAGAGIQGNSFNISLLIEYISQYKDISRISRKWFAQSQDIILRELTDF